MIIVSVHRNEKKREENDIVRVVSKMCDCIRLLHVLINKFPYINEVFLVYLSGDKTLNIIPIK